MQLRNNLMMKMMRITVKKIISIFFGVETLVLTTYLYSPTLFANVQVAFLSSLFVILGSAFAYKKMVQTQVDSGTYEEQRDLLDDIEDPHELYDKVNDEVREGTLGYESINDTPVEELDLKAIVKEEKAKIKTFSLKSMKHGARGSVSMFRIGPYIFLILGFIALKNNDVLDLSFYLPSLMIGIIAGSLMSKEITS